MLYLFFGCFCRRSASAKGGGAHIPSSSKGRRCGCCGSATRKPRGGRYMPAHVSDSDDFTLGDDVEL